MGDCGRGVRAAAKQYRDLGMVHVDEMIYQGMRHEVLNEPGRAQVYRDVLAWFDAVLGNADGSR